MLIKLIDENTKQVEVGYENFRDFYIRRGFVEVPDDAIEIAWNFRAYMKGYAPVKPDLTNEEIADKRRAYREKVLDNKTLERIKKQALGNWSDKDEEDYIVYCQQIEDYLNKEYPYNL